MEIFVEIWCYMAVHVPVKEGTGMGGGRALLATKLMKYWNWAEVFLSREEFSF